VALLSQMFRSVAITGDTQHLNAWFATRQGGRWAEQTVRNAFPRGIPKLHELNALHRDGLITDAEYADLRARYQRA
jgi:hypothetical protein